MAHMICSSYKKQATNLLNKVNVIQVIMSKHNAIESTIRKRKKILSQNKDKG